MTKISTSGILISIFIGIVFGLKMQDDNLSRPGDGQVSAALQQAISPIARAHSEEKMEQEVTEELNRYIKNNFNFSTLKVHWVQYIKGYDITIKGKNVSIVVRTSLSKPGSNTTYILNAVQGFMKSRLPDGYQSGHIEIRASKGKALTDREVILSQKQN